MNRPFRARTLTGIAALLLTTALISTGCGKDRWCELDATDTRVDNAFCENGTPGYEWEPDSDKGTSVKTSKKPKH
ncbi:hypothetical protein [Nocardia carnea]|uniref:hypothetical protein n=1 Tax=Nocardia carnea TaxID=37328 RepID=UPI0024552E95|nr:hypothetical protein [Nocardia carnea]